MCFFPSRANAVEGSPNSPCVFVDRFGFGCFVCVFILARCGSSGIVYVEVGDRKARLLEYARKSLEEAEALKREFLGDRVFLVDVANLTDWGATFLNWLCDNKEEEAFYDSSLGRNSDSREQALRRK